MHVAQLAPLSGAGSGVRPRGPRRRGSSIRTRFSGRGSVCRGTATLGCALAGCLDSSAQAGVPVLRKPTPPNKLIGRWFSNRQVPSLGDSPTHGKQRTGSRSNRQLPRGAAMESLHYTSCRIAPRAVLQGPDSNLQNLPVNPCRVEMPLTRRKQRFGARSTRQFFEGGKRNDSNDRRINTRCEKRVGSKRSTAWRISRRGGACAPEASCGAWPARWD